MANVIDANGLQVNTYDEWVTYFTAAFETIYGADIDLSSNTPDGQMMGIYIQALLDLSDLLVQIYNTFDPDNAIGTILDQRVAINGIQRQAGTYSTTNVSITASQALNLYGLDQDVQDVFTVADNAGNQWQLITTENVPSSGTYVLAFQAASPGAVVSAINTITVPVTIVLGVTAINNPTTYTTLGINEESDAVLKIRRQQSVALGSQGYLAGLLGALENINGVSSAFVYENTTNITDGDGVPGHTIWVVVAGSGAAADIAQAIYEKRNAGCGMFGDTDYTITQIDGSNFVVSWDDVVSENLFIYFTATSIDGTTPPNLMAILDGLPLSFVPGVADEVNINALATAVQVIDPNTLVTSAGFSSALSQILTLSGIAASGTFKINYNGHQSAAINWNDAVGTIQTKTQAVTGLSGTLVTGSIASQTLTFNLAAELSSEGLIYVTNNSLATVAPAAITFAYSTGATNTLSPTTKKNQFVVSADNILILVMVFVPSAAIVATTETQQFTAYGGYGTYTYSILTNNSGGSINSSTGLYTAGITGSVTDVVKVIDVFGNIATANVTVT